MKKLDEFIRQCCEEISNEIIQEKAADNYPHEAFTIVNTNDGWVELYVSSLHGKHVTVEHDNGEERDSHNLAKFIEKALPDWDDVYEEEYCTGVDPGFSSYQDYLDYKYN